MDSRTLCKTVSPILKPRCVWSSKECRVKWIILVHKMKYKKKHAKILLLMSLLIRLHNGYTEYNRAWNINLINLDFIYKLYWKSICMFFKLTKHCNIAERKEKKLFKKSLHFDNLMTSHYHVREMWIFCLIKATMESLIFHAWILNSLWFRLIVFRLIVIFFWSLWSYT